MKKMVKFSFAAMMLSATFFGTTTAAPVTADAKSTYNNCTAFNKCISLWCSKVSKYEK